MAVFLDTFRKENEVKIAWVYFEHPVVLSLFRDSVKHLGLDIEFVDAKMIQSNADIERFDIVIFYKPFEKELWELLNRTDIVKKANQDFILWTTDDPFEFDDTMYNAIHVDMVVTNDQVCSDYLNASGFPSIVFCGGATERCIEAFSLPVDAAFESDMCFFGSAFPYRKMFLSAFMVELFKHEDLRTKKYVIAGHGWQEAFPGLPPNFVFLPGQEEGGTPRFYRNAKVCLNLHRMNDMDMRNSRRIFPSSMCQRDFDMAAVGGGVILTDNSRPELLKHYKDSYVMPFQWLNVEDFAQKLSFLLSQPDKVRRDMALAARTVTLEKFQFDEQFAGVIEKLEKLH